MNDWLMQHPLTGDVRRIPPEEFWRYWKNGYRPISDRTSNGNDYQKTRETR